MSRRLEEATEEALVSGGTAGRRAVQDAGFSEELRDRLLSKVAGAGLDPSASSVVVDGDRRIPEAAGAGTRDLAAAQPWTGEEATEDVVLRMLDDARKPLQPGLRGQYKVPAPSKVVDLRLRREPKVSAGAKVAAARDKAATYTGMGMKGAQDRGLTPEARQALREEFRERFTPAARPMPNTVSGLAALANERIEDAISRGQFKNIPRGKGVERDTRADNPFVDTTEYIMNNMIKRQDIVPPWIEKQQELVKDAGVFRARLRNDWKRHAARMIAGPGGSLQEQMARAEEYARAEEVHNPRRRHGGPVLNSTDAATTNKPPQNTLSRPFRDPAWEAAERSYMELAVDRLNALTRTYNLMAPELARKPYFSLERELNSCFAEVAPQLAGEIKERAARPPKTSVSTLDARTGAVFGRFGSAGGAAKIYESKAPKYGFREMWRDLWSGPPTSHRS